MPPFAHSPHSRSRPLPLLSKHARLTHTSPPCPLQTPNLQHQAELSYSYWAAGSAKAGAPTADPANAPRKLTEEEAAALREQQQRAAGGTAASAWNAVRR